MSNIKPSGATSYKETSFGIIPRSQLLPLEIQGVKKGLEFIYQLIETNNNIEINSQLICELHNISFKWIFPDWAGKFRTIQVCYSNKEAPPYHQVPKLIQNLCDDLKTRLINLPQSTEKNYTDNIIELLAWFQHRFVFIHPFNDYNGRTARMFTTLLLLKLDLPAMEIKIEKELDRKKYLSAMQQGDNHNLLPLEQLISDSLIEELTDL